MLYPQGQGEIELVRTGGDFSRFFCGRLLWTAPSFHQPLSKMAANEIQTHLRKNVYN